MWLLYRQSGRQACSSVLSRSRRLLILLIWYGFAQRREARAGSALLVAFDPRRRPRHVAGAPRTRREPKAPPGPSRGAKPRWRVRGQRGHPVFVYFTADWCLTCKVNEAAAIDRDEVRDAFKAAGVTVLAGDWTNGDPAITRFLESQGRAGVPYYLWYAPGQPPEALPQILTPSMLISRARRRSARQRAATPSCPPTHVSSTCVRASA